jgi:hypothetical protein
VQEENPDLHNSQFTIRSAPFRSVRDGLYCIYDDKIPYTQDILDLFIIFIFHDTDWTIQGTSTSSTRNLIPFTANIRDQTPLRDQRRRFFDLRLRGTAKPLASLVITGVTFRRREPRSRFEQNPADFFPASRNVPKPLSLLARTPLDFLKPF